MKNRKKIITVLIAAAAAVLLLLGLVLSAHRRQVSAQEDALSLSEVSPQTFVCPEGGGLCSWAELHNTYEKDTDISGFSLSLDSGEAYVFPEGSILPAGGFILVHFGSGCEGAYSAPFSLPESGGETLTLMSGSGRPLDSITLLPAEAGKSQLRTADGPSLSDAPSPGFENDDAGRQEYLRSIPAGEAGSLRISEIMVKNRSVFQAADGSFPDWIELENTSDGAVNIGGWFLSDGEGAYGCALPDLNLEPGQRLLIMADGKPSSDGEIHVDYALSQGETVCLYTSYGLLADSLFCDTDTANHSVCRDENGGIMETKWATPGKANTRDGYEEYCKGQTSGSPLVINEVMAANQSWLYQQDLDSYCDWVELKNISDSPVLLSDYWLSDDEENYLQWQLPEISLAPGGTYIVCCTNDIADAARSGFSLDANEEELFLCTEKGVADYVYLHDMPVDGSMGRLDGQAGFFYFRQPSPGWDNSGGSRFVSEKPEVLTPDGVYDNIESLSVELSSPGTVYYTTDGSVPTVNSRVYDGPVTISETTVIRAIAVEENAVPSRVLTLSYIVNEGHTLPVLSLVTDNRSRFNAIYTNGTKYVELPGSLSLYENGEGFTIACGVSMKGWTSLGLPKKSMGVSFRGCYGDGDLEYDVFGNGIDLYSSLSIRAGQDYPRAIIRNELFQELCLEMTDHVVTQESKYCVLYIDGEYWGIYCLKEDFTRQYYASHTGSSKESVTMLRSSISRDSALYQEVFQFCFQNDMALEENYRHFCSLFDVDSLIDWIILEAYCANSDINGNMRYFRTSENGGKWQIAFYDLDWTFRWTGNCFDNTIYPTRAVQIAPLINALLENEEFCMALARRCAEVCQSTLSNAHVLAKIDEMQALIEPEVPRERERWGLSLHSWYTSMDALRDYINDFDYENYMTDRLFHILNLSAEQREALLEGKETP